MKKRINLKPAAGAILIYLTLTAGLWMFMYSLMVSESRMTGETREPVQLGVSGSSISLSVGSSCYEADTAAIVQEHSGALLAAYLFAPDELKAGIYLLCRYSSDT
ncbi:MAG: hypothetical protein IJ874_05380 [Ruminococcus sp.]|nr:hypothetical protein [Ruminococcus sp.]